MSSKKVVNLEEFKRNKLSCPTTVEEVLDLGQPMPPRFKELFEELKKLKETYKHLYKND